MLNYAYLNHDRYANGKDKLFVGYDANGNLTRNPKWLLMKRARLVRTSA